MQQRFDQCGASVAHLWQSWEASGQVRVKTWLGLGRLLVVLVPVSPRRSVWQRLSWQQLHPRTAWMDGTQASCQFQGSAEAPGVQQLQSGNAQQVAV